MPRSRPADAAGNGDSHNTAKQRLVADWRGEDKDRPWI